MAKRRFEIILELEVETTRPFNVSEFIHNNLFYDIRSLDPTSTVDDVLLKDWEETT